MKSLARLLALAMSATALVLPAAATPPDGTGPETGSVAAAADTRFKTVTRSFASTDAVQIPDGVAVPYPATIKVGGLAGGRLTDVDLKLAGFGHGFPDDVDVLLVAPGGRRAVVLSDVGGSDPTGPLTLILNDEATSPIPTDGPLVGGAFRPTDRNEPPPDTFPSPAPGPSERTALSTFDGIDPNGTWRLYVRDDSNTETGSIAGWSLRITARARR